MNTDMLLVLLLLVSSLILIGLAIGFYDFIYTEQSNNKQPTKALPEPKKEIKYKSTLHYLFTNKSK